MTIKEDLDMEAMKLFQSRLRDAGIEIICSSCFPFKKIRSHNTTSKKPQFRNTKRMKIINKAKWQSITPIKESKQFNDYIYKRPMLKSHDENISHLNTDTKKYTPLAFGKPVFNAIEKGKFNIKQLFEETFKTPIKFDDSPICGRLNKGNILGNDYKAGVIHLTEVKNEFGDWSSIKDLGFDHSDHVNNYNEIAMRNSPSPFHSPFIAFSRNQDSNLFKNNELSKIQKSLDFLDNPFTPNQ